MKQELGSSQHELLILLNHLPGLNMVSKKQKHQMVRLIFDTDEQRNTFENEIYRLNSLLRLPLITSTGERLDIGSNKEIAHKIPTVGAAIREDALRIFEELRKNNTIDRKFTAEQAALLIYAKLVKDNYSEIFDKFRIVLGLENLSELQDAIRAYLKKTNPEYRHIKDIDRKYDEKILLDVLANLIRVEEGYWLKTRFGSYPFADESVRYNEFVTQSGHDQAKFIRIAMLRTNIYARRNNFDHADYSFMASLFFQSCIEMTTTKMYLPKPLNDWIVFGIPKASFYKHLDGMKKTFPDEAKSVDVIIKILPWLWGAYRKAESQGRGRLTDAEALILQNSLNSLSRETV